MEEFEENEEDINQDKDKDFVGFKVGGGKNNQEIK